MGIVMLDHTGDLKKRRWICRFDTGQVINKNVNNDCTGGNVDLRLRWHSLPFVVKPSKHRVVRNRQVSGKTGRTTMMRKFPTCCIPSRRGVWMKIQPALEDVI